MTGKDEDGQGPTGGRAERRGLFGRRRRRRVVVVEQGSVWPLLVQFFLTTVIGTVLLGIYQEEQARRQFVDGSFERVEGFFESAVVRRQRGDLIRSSIRRDAALQELIERKTAYDEAYLTFNADYTKALIGLRGGFGSSRETLFECAINRYVITWYGKLDGCLTHAYDDALDGGVSAGRQVGGLTFPRVGGGFDDPPREGYPEAARTTLARCARSMSNTRDRDAEPQLSSRVMSRMLRTCTTAIAQQMTDERARVRGLLAPSHDALWGDTGASAGGVSDLVDDLALSLQSGGAAHISAMADEIDGACGVDLLRELFPTDRKFQGPLEGWCRAERARR